MAGAAWADADHILCVRLDSLGDVLMTSPAFAALKEARPERRLTLLSSPAGAAAAPFLPDLDDCLVYDAPWLKATAPRADSRPELAMVEDLRARRFDAAIIFTVFSQNPLPSALLCHLADIPLRLAHCRENPYQLLSDWVPESEPESGIRHEVRRQLDLVARLGCRPRHEGLRFAVPADAQRRVAALLTEWGLADGRPWVLLHPGASAPSRRYPPELFAQVAGRLVRELGWPVLFSGGREEVPLVEQIRAAMGAPSRSSAGLLDLAGLGALLAQAPLMISNNTGPVHMAAALGTPVVDLYALTNPQHTPWGVPQRVLFHDLPCRNCFKSVCPQGHHDCLRKVPPDAVVVAARELMAEGLQGVDQLSPRRVAGSGCAASRTLPAG